MSRGVYEGQVKVIEGNGYPTKALSIGELGCAEVIAMTLEHYSHAATARDGRIAEGGCAEVIAMTLTHCSHAVARA